MLQIRMLYIYDKEIKRVVAIAFSVVKQQFNAGPGMISRLWEAKP